MGAQLVQDTGTPDARPSVVAILSDGSGACSSIGALDRRGVLPRLRARKALLQRFAGLDAEPVSIEIRDVARLADEVVAATAAYDAVLLAEIASPRALVLQQMLAERLEVPVVHDAREPAGMVILATVWNALVALGKHAEESRVVVSGLDATAVEAANLLHELGMQVEVHADHAAGPTHLEIVAAQLRCAGPIVESTAAASAAETDVLIGGSFPGGLSRWLPGMTRDSVVVLLDTSAEELSAAQVRADAGQIGALATRFSALPNWLDWALTYPGVLRGLLTTGSRRLTPAAQLAGARALAGLVDIGPRARHLIPRATRAPATEAVVAAIRSSVEG